MLSYQYSHKNDTNIEFVAKDAEIRYMHTNPHGFRCCTGTYDFTTFCPSTKVFLTTVNIIRPPFSPPATHVFDRTAMYEQKVKYNLLWVWFYTSK